MCMVAAFLKCSRVNLANFPLSHSTAIRRRKQVLTESYEGSRESFREKVVTEDDKLFLHLDTKSLADSIGPHGAGVTNVR